MASSDEPRLDVPEVLEVLEMTPGHGVKVGIGRFGSLFTLYFINYMIIVVVIYIYIHTSCFFVLSCIVSYFFNVDFVYH